MRHESVVFRSIAFPVDVFDYLKDFQRHYKLKHGVALTNNQLLAIILREHQQTALSAPSGSHTEEAMQ